ncbi:MAG: hypothetical protein K8I30_21575, partial [Anaerolineae bacterium]|nr:hypothetical protein [Anaerolineae bacterium]
MTQNTRFRTFILCTLIVLSLMVWGGVTPAAAQFGTTPPILLVVNDSAPNKFGRYLGEILSAEGLNSYDTVDLNTLTGTQIAGYKVAILAETPLTVDQAALFTNYVSGGGYLIAMRPDAQIKSLFGLDTISGTQTDGYLKMSGTGPSAGLSTETLQIHGTSDLYTTAAGAVVQAQLYSDATTATAFPAVVSDAAGHGIAFTYDLASNVVYTRQGNPANANVDTDGDGVIRARDVFVSPTGNHWIDLNKVPIPQADEQQRLLARLVKAAVETAHPLPQVWYFPGTAKTMLIPTGDAHANPMSFYEDTLNIVENYGGTMTVYLAIGAPDNGTIQMWRSRGHEFGMHPYIVRPDNYLPFNVENLVQGYQVADSWFSMSYSSPKSRTVRAHDLGWIGWTDAAELATTYGLKLSTDFLAWGPFLQKTDGSWAHGYVDGTGQPMRMMKQDGTILDYYRQSVPIVDVQLMCFPGYENLTNAQALQVSQQLIDSSLAGDYAVLSTFFQIDCGVGFGTLPWVEGTVAYAQSHGIPIWDADRWLGFIESRYATDYSNMAWDESSKTFSFSMTGTASGYDTTTVIPLIHNGSDLTSVTVDGSPAAFSTQLIKGKNEAFVVVPAGNHSFTAVYGGVLGTPTPQPMTPTATPVTPTATLETPTVTPITPTLEPTATIPTTSTPVTPTATLPPPVGGSTPILVVVNGAAPNKFGRY